MNKSALLLVCAAFAAIGCGSEPKQAPKAPEPTKIVGTPQPAAPAPPPPAAEPEQPPAAETPEEPAEPAEPAPQITCKLPGGWVSFPSSRLPPGITAAYLNPEKGGQVVVRPAPEAGKTPAEQAAIIRKLIASNPNNSDVKLSKVTTSRDGKTSSFTIDAGETHAKLVVRKLSDDGSYSFLAKWNAANEKDLAPQVDQIIKSAQLQK